LKQINPHCPEPHTGPQTHAHREESRLVEHFQRLTAEQNVDIGIILGNHRKLLGNGDVEATVNFINLNRMTLTAIKTYFDRFDRDGSASRRPRRSHRRDD
jgi:hypothetical protein